MKLITLNTWGGRIQPDLDSFLERHSPETDIFCFQEVYNGGARLPANNDIVANWFALMQTLLQEFEGFHAESGNFAVGQAAVPYGIAMFVRRRVKILGHGVDEIFKLDEEIGLQPGLQIWNRLLQHISISYNGSQLTIYNLHGLYTGGGKDDEPARLRQSERVRKFMDGHSGEKILCGDFNLNPETESLTILKQGMRDLVQEQGITSTRTHFYPAGKPTYADYMLVSPGITVKKFQVLPDVVSDHSPLMLEFE